MRNTSRSCHKSRQKLGFLIKVSNSASLFASGKNSWARLESKMQIEFFWVSARGRWQFSPTYLSVVQRIRTSARSVCLPRHHRGSLHFQTRSPPNQVSHQVLPKRTPTCLTCENHSQQQMILSSATEVISTPCQKPTERKSMETT